MSETAPDTPEFRDEYARLMRQRASIVAADQSALLPMEQLLSLAEGQGADDERLAQLDRVLGDPTMRQEYLVLRSVVRTHDEMNSTAATRAGFRAPRWIAAAAAAVLLVTASIVMRDRSPAVPEPYRGAAALVALVSPGADAEIAKGVAFRWTALDEAESYELLLLDDDGEVLLRRSTTDTSFTIEAPIPRGGQWTVTARLRDGRQVPSDTRRFTVGSSPVR